MSEVDPKRLKILFATSTGGHLTQLLALRDWWGEHDRRWVTFENMHAKASLRGERIAWAHFPTTRNIPNAFRNARLAWRVLTDYRPDIVISTGGAVAVPFMWTARALGIRTLFIEVIDRITSRTLTGRMVYPIVDGFGLQWPEQETLYPDATIVGATL